MGKLIIRPHRKVEGETGLCYKNGFFRSTKMLRNITANVNLLIWWQLGDLAPEQMRCCETMLKLVCNCKVSRLKSDCYPYKKDISNRLYCDLCGALAIEDAEHIILHCPYT